MKQTKDEIAIDDRYRENSDSDVEGDLDDKIKDMETRLYKLKGIDPGGVFMFVKNEQIFNNL